MKYIITEEQQKVLKEINVSSGKFDVKAITYFYRHFATELLTSNKFKKLISLTKKFFRTRLGIDLSGWEDQAIENYLISIRDDSFVYDYLKSFKGIFKKPSTNASLSYYLAKNLVKLDDYQGLQYFKQVDKPFTRFYFFDPEIEEFVGYMELQKSLSLPYKSMKVNLSAVEKEYVGRGYGSRMYLCVINTLDYLRSDDTLYPDSLNMWVNYLPEKVNVWANIDNHENETKEFVMLSKKKFINPDEVNFYVASVKNSKPPFS